MKKLMITAAALLTACVVGAAVQGGTPVSGTDFESYTVGAFNPALDDEGDSDQGTYWSTTQAGESEVKEESEGGNKFLAIDETVPLYRNMYKSNENQQSATVDVEQSVYFSSQVKFTASEDASMTPNAGDKLIVWLRSVDGEGPTNLIVTAYNSAEEAAQDYVIDNKTISDDAFHTLTIVASADDGAVKFTVSVDGDVLSSGGVTEFQSLVRGGTGIDTITCAGFKGSGAIDDIEFGTIEENPTKYYEVNGVEYIEFADALEAAASAEDPTVTLINDAVLVYDDVAEAGHEISGGTELTIDLAGHTISCAGAVFANYGTLNIQDTVGGGSVKNTDDEVPGFSSIDNYGGTVNISGGKYWGEVYNEGGTVVVTLNNNPAELVYDNVSGYWVIQASGEQPPEPTVVQIPTAASNLVYDGTEQTGVAAGTGYTLTGTAAAMNAGDYSATATLEEGYIWSDESTEAKTINWSIAKAQVTATVSLTVTSATYDSEKDDVTDYTTPSVNFGLGAPELVEDTDYTGAWSATEVTGAGTFTYTVSPVANSNYTFTEASATLTITEGGEEAWPTGTDLDELEGKKVQDVYTGISADFDKVDAKTFVTWASGNGGVAYADKGTTTFNIDCFLLNIANNSSAEQIAAATTTAAEAIKITAITFDEDGKPVITAAESYGNGVVVIEGTISLEDIEWHAKADGDHFFRTKLVVDEVEDPQP